MTRKPDITVVQKLKTDQELLDLLQSEGVKDNIDPANYYASEFKNKILQLHNLYRSKHGVPDVTRDSGLDASAQKWSDHLAMKGIVEHEGSSCSYGENLYSCSTSCNLPKPEMLAEILMQGFYIEGKGYNYRKFEADKKYKGPIGHFTQMIWNNCKSIGVGLSIKRPHQPSKYKNIVYVCIKYDPAGNSQLKKENLFSPVVSPEGNLFIVEQLNKNKNVNHHCKRHNWLDCSTGGGYFTESRITGNTVCGWEKFWENFDNRLGF